MLAVLQQKLESLQTALRTGKNANLIKLIKICTEISPRKWDLLLTYPDLKESLQPNETDRSYELLNALVNSSGCSELRKKL